MFNLTRQSTGEPSISKSGRAVGYFVTANPPRGQAYKWDAFNRLARVDGAGRVLARYLYDATGRRLRKDIPAAATANFSTGVHAPTRAAANDDASGASWSNPGNLFGAGSATAAFSGAGYSKDIYASGYGFAVPLGAAIDRIEAYIARYCDNESVEDGGVSLVWPGGAAGPGTPYDEATGFATEWQNVGYSYDDDTWGRAWSPAELNSPAFGVALRAAAHGADTAYVDAVTLEVWYTLPAQAHAWTDYAWDGWQILEQRVNGGANPERQWVYGVYIDEPLVMDVNGNGDSSCVSTGDSRYFYHQNLNYSVLGLTDANGVLVEAYAYTPYGRHVVLSDGDSDGAVEFDGTDAVSAQDAPSPLGNPYLFTGRQLDGETGIYYYRYRYYDGQIGRFMSRDPIREIESPGSRRFSLHDDKLSAVVSPYSYAYPNPITNMDTKGLKTITWEVHNQDYLTFNAGIVVSSFSGGFTWQRNYPCPSKFSCRLDAAMSGLVLGVSFVTPVRWTGAWSDEAMHDPSGNWVGWGGSISLFKLVGYSVISLHNTAYSSGWTINITFTGVGSPLEGFGVNASLECTEIKEEPEYDRFD